MNTSWSGATTAIVNHLWQSTVFGIVAAAVTLLLKKNAAAIRFCVWLSASVKFLIPLSLFIKLGTLMSPIRSGVRFAAFFESSALPFRQSASSVVIRQMWWERHSDLMPVILGAIWGAGTLTVCITWSYQWWLVTRARKAARLLEHGEEITLMRSVATQMQLPPTSILLASTSMEPGVMGLLRPVLLWPIGLTKALNEPQLTAVLTHELCHVRRRDNLTASIQMFVQALFWFHPLVWWFGRQQMEERERACDEGVLAFGIPPDVYAESILIACKFCVEAPLPCVAGVNGSNLKQRITRIMTIQAVARLSTAKKFVLSAVAAASFAIPVLIGMSAGANAGAQTAMPDISSAPLHIIGISKNLSGDPMTQIKHTAEGTTIRNTTVRNLIEMAYSVKSYQLAGGPAWIDTDHFDVAYTGGEPAPSSQRMISPAALKDILAERFHLVMHQETKPGPVLALVVAEGGPKFASVTPKMAPGTSEPLLSMRVMQKDGKGIVAITGGPSGLAETLAAQVGRPVLDRTGLTGIYGINFEWATSSVNSESLSRQLQQQLGLTLSPQEGMVETSTVESIELPAGS